MFLLKGHRGPVRSVAFSADGRTLLSLGRAFARVWDLRGRSLMWNGKGGEGIARRAGFTPDQRAVLTLDWQGQPRLWSMDHGRRLDLPPELAGREGLNAFSFSPDGALLVASESHPDNALHWWRWPGGDALPEWAVHPRFDYFHALAFRPDGLLLAGMNRSGVRVFEVESGLERRMIPFPVVQATGQLAFSPDGRRSPPARGCRSWTPNRATRSRRCARSGSSFRRSRSRRTASS
jgi:WD40 repeat protein